MGKCFSIPDEARRGPIRTRFDLDSAPDDAPKSVEHVATPPDAPAKNPKEAPERRRFRFPLIGHKNIIDRNVVLNAFFPSPPRENRTRSDENHEKSHHLTLLSDLYEYLPQVPTHLVGLTYHARHPTLRDTLYFLSYRNNPLTENRRWTKEVYGTTWPTVVRSSAVHTYDPILKHNVRTIRVTDILIYDSKAFIAGSVYLVLRDTDGNEHVVVPYPAPNEDGHQYGVRLNIEQDMYIDEVDTLLETMREHLTQKKSLSLSRTTEPTSTKDGFQEKPVIEGAETEEVILENTREEDQDTADGAIGDEIGDAVESDDEEGIQGDTDGPKKSQPQESRVASAIRMFEEVMGEATTNATASGSGSESD